MTTMLAQDATVLGACPHDCPDTCSMLVKVANGKVTGVQGNPAHPFTQGRLCAKTSHYQERVYHPERVLYPMRRSGPKGSGQFERISWTKRWRRSASAGARSSRPTARPRSCRTAIWARRASSMA